MDDRPTYETAVSRWLVPLLAILCFGVAEAQKRPIRFERLSEEDGLSQTTIIAVHQDREGYVWFCTEDGLNRYDGVRFTVYKHDPNDAGSLPHDAVMGIDEDRQGNLWVATEGGGAAMLDRRSDRFVRYRQDPGNAQSLASNYARTILVDDWGRVWVGLREHGLDRIDPASGRVTHFAHDPADAGSLSDDRVYVLFQGRDRSLWVGTNGGLDRLEPGSRRFSHYVNDPDDSGSLSDDQVRSILEDRSGTLWVGTLQGGLNRLDAATGSFVRLQHDPAIPGSLSHDRVRAILEDRAGRLWVGTGRGLDLMVAADRFVAYQHDPARQTSLSEDNVMSLAQNRDGVLWIGTRSGGVNRWNPLTWQFGHYDDGLTEKNVTSLAEDYAGSVYVGSIDSGVDIVDRASGKTRHLRHDPAGPESLNSNRVTAMRLDRSGMIWIGTLDGGLNRLDPQSGRLDSFRHDPEQPGSISANGVMELFEDSRGRLWVGTFGSGLDRFEAETGTFVNFRHDPSDRLSLSGDRVTALAEAEDGTMWVGTDGAGLDLFVPWRNEFVHFDHDEDDPTSLSSASVFTLLLDLSGTLWIGTRGGGLDRLDAVPLDPDAAVFRHYGERDGLANDVVYGILPDSTGNLWLSTNRGLSRFDPKTETFTNFDETHGLQAAEFNFNAYFRSTRGELFFGGVNGFNAFVPERLKRNEHVPPVVLTGLYKLNRPATGLGPVDRIERIELGHRDDVVTFEFAALDFAASRGNRYAYMLEGFDRDWIELGNLNRVTYTNLDAAQYVLRVKASNNDGVWNQEGLAIALDVAPPPWGTVWAYAAYLFCGLGLCYGFVQSQQRRLRREAEYSQRLERQVHERTFELARRAAELEELNDKLTKASLTDPLTGLANRRFLVEHVEKEVELANRKRRARDTGAFQPDLFDIGFMMVDLDDFKAINDTCGHAAGDAVLVQVRKILQAACRSSDILTRWGGDEFLIVGRELDAKGLDGLAERIRSEIANHFFELEDGRVVHTTCSIGFATYPFIHSDVDAISWENVIDIADAALYVSKRNGRNAWVGLASTERTSPDRLLACIREEPSRLAQEGMLEVRTSAPILTALAAH